MKPPRRVTQLLALATVGVWGTIGYQIYSTSLAHEPEPGGTESTNPVEKGDPFVYTGNVRDPFQNIARDDSTRTRKVIRKIEQWIPPPLKVTGILEEHSKRTAIVEGPKGEVTFLTEKDTLLGVTILKIHRNHILFKYRGEKKEWVLEGM